MKPIWLLAMLWGALCLGGSMWAALGLQDEVGGVALQGLVVNGTPVEGIKVQAEGQALVMTGTASRQSDIESVARRLSDELRLPGTFGRGAGLNPVRRVVNETVLVPRPEGWGVLAATGSAVHLRGVGASENEANRIGLAVRSSGQLGRGFTSDLAVDGEAFIESDHLETTIRTVPSLTVDSMKQGLLAVATWGGNWHILEINKPAETLRREILAKGLPDSAWESDLFTEVERVRVARESYLAGKEEKQRQGSLAPGHVVMAVRGSQILLRGELGTSKACELLAEAIQKNSPDRIVIDELAHSSHRKPESSPNLLLSGLPTLPTGLLTQYLAVGTPDSGWKEMEVEGLDLEDKASVSQTMLPEGLDPRLALPDVITAISWIHSIESAPQQRDVAHKPPYFMLTAVGSHVYLRGVVAEEAVRTQVEAAARRLYASRELDVEVRLDGACQSIGQALQTLATLPPPPAPDTSGFIAFAFGGDEWHRKPAHARLLEPLGLQQSGLLPDGLSVNLFMPDVLAIAPAVKAQLSLLSLNTPPGIPEQPASPP
ncbi:MAG: hypothetical protein JWO94_2202 [Verrucomicrobiaceae bacterium]|nr:hypothetical protein [Verrucomicrobiaceae bacterium]